MKLSVISYMAAFAVMSFAEPALAHTSHTHETVNLVHGLSYPMTDASHASAWLAGISLVVIGLIGCAFAFRRLRAGRCSNE